jgi:hypothetical protein
MGLNVRDFGAAGDGEFDDTDAFQAAIDAASLTGDAVAVPTGTYKVGNLLFGDQSTGSQSTAPTALVGSGSRAIIKAAAGTTGTLLQAWSIAGVRLSNFVVDCSDAPGVDIAIDTEWKPGIGASIINVYDFVIVQGYAGTGWFARNNNDCSWRHVVVRQSVSSDGSQVAIDNQGAGGPIWMDECIWQGGILDLTCQNATIRGGWGDGIRLNHDQTGENVLHLDACYIYLNETSGCGIWDDDPSDPGHWARMVTATGTLFVSSGPGQSILGFGMIAGMALNGVIGGAVSRAGAGRPQVIANGLVLAVGCDVAPPSGIDFQPILIDNGGSVSNT